MLLSPTDWHPIIWIWLLSAAAFVALLFWTRKSDTPGAPAFRGLSLANIVYITAAALELATTNSTLWWWIAGIMHMGIGLIGPCLFILFADITGQNHWLTPVRRRWLVWSGLALGAMRFADPWLGWMYLDVQMFLDQGMVLRQFRPGPLFILMQSLLVAAMLGGMVMCWKTWREAGPLLRKHIWILTLACLVPISISTLFAIGGSPWGWLDPTPGASVIALAITSWAVFRNRLVEVAPIARNFLIEHLSEGVLVVDRTRTVVDFNPTARRQLRLSGEKTLGQPLATILAHWPALGALCASNNLASAEISPDAKSDTCWSCVWYPLTDTQPKHQGYMLVVSDITSRKNIERRLEELLETRTQEWQRATTEALHAAEEEQTRLGHLLHDTLCQDLIGFRRTIDAVAADSDARNASRLRTLSEQLSDAHRRAREVTHLLEGPDLVHNSFEDALEATIHHLEQTFGITCEVTLDSAFTFSDHEHGRHLLRIIREAIANAARHAKAQNIWVDLLVTPKHRTITITNDGLPPPTPETLTEGLGTRQMRMRATLLGGSIALRAGTTDGATFELLLPHDGPHPSPAG